MAFAYRTSVQPSIGLSPFQLLYGRQACQPANLEFSLPRRPRFKDAHHYLADVRRAQREAVELAEEFLAASQGRQSSNYPVAELKKFSVGDAVLLHDPAMRHGASYKLARPWKGPYVIEECLGRVNYLIRPAEGGRASVVHYNRLKKYKSRTSPDGSSADMLLHSSSPSSGSISLDAGQHDDDDCEPSSGDSQDPEVSAGEESGQSSDGTLDLESNLELQSSESPGSIASVDEDVCQSFTPPASPRRGADLQSELPSRRCRRRPRYLDDYVTAK